MRGLACNAVGAAAVFACGLLSDPALCAGIGGDPTAASPVLFDIVPNSGRAGIAYPLRATIHGTGFMPTGNIVEFGPATIANVASREAGSLTFNIPKAMPSHGEVPPAVFTAGQYPVRVRTPAGTSNALMFTLTRDG